MRRAGFAVAALGVAFAAGPVAAQPAAGPAAEQVVVPAPDDGLTTDTFHRRGHIPLVWGLLNIPERIVQLAFVPLGLLVGVVEEKRLDKRIKVLFKFGNFKISPRFKLAFSDGLGLGLKLKYKQPLDSRTEAALGFIYRINGDYLIDANLEQPFGSLNDRKVYATALIERDINQRFYGIGGGSDHDSKRVLGDNHQAVYLAADLQPTTWFDYSGVLQVGLFRQTLGEGEQSGTASVSTMDTVTPPPGFERAVTYLNPTLSGRYDTRDTQGRPSRGLLAQVSADAMIGLSSQSIGGVKLRGEVQWFLPILPETRVLIFDAGGAATIPLYPGDTIPLATYVDFGRENYLRGYDRLRYRDRYGVWANAEYRFPVYKYAATPVGIDAFTFFDSAVAWGDDKFKTSNIHYSYGGGLRLAAETTLVIQSTFGFSPEGFQFFIGGENRF